MELDNKKPLTLSSFGKIDRSNSWANGALLHRTSSLGKQKVLKGGRMHSKGRRYAKLVGLTGECFDTDMIGLSKIGKSKPSV